MDPYNISTEFQGLAKISKYTVTFGAETKNINHVKSNSYKVFGRVS